MDYLDVIQIRPTFKTLEPKQKLSALKELKKWIKFQEESIKSGLLSKE